jgi:hypothetical protein
MKFIHVNVIRKWGPYHSGRVPTIANCCCKLLPYCNRPRVFTSSGRAHSHSEEHIRGSTLLTESLTKLFASLNLCLCCIFLTRTNKMHSSAPCRDRVQTYPLVALLLLCPPPFLASSPYVRRIRGIRSAGSEKCSLLHLKTRCPSKVNGCLGRTCPLNFLTNYGN